MHSLGIPKKHWLSERAKMKGKIIEMYVAERHVYILYEACVYCGCKETEISFAYSNPACIGPPVTKNVRCKECKRLISATKVGKENEESEHLKYLVDLRERALEYEASLDEGLQIICDRVREGLLPVESIAFVSALRRVKILQIGLDDVSKRLLKDEEEYLEEARAKFRELIRA